MNHIAFSNHWEQIKGQLKQRYAQLADDDLVFMEGKGEELMGRLREKLSMNEEDLERVLDELYHMATNRLTRAKESMNEWAGEAAHKMQEQASVAYERARERAQGAWDDGEEYVRRNPRQSLLSAFIAGFVAGLLIVRR